MWSHTLDVELFGVSLEQVHDDSCSFWGLISLGVFLTSAKSGEGSATLNFTWNLHFLGSRKTIPAEYGHL